MDKTSIPVRIIPIEDLAPDTYFLIPGSSNGYYKDPDEYLIRLSDGVIIQEVDCGTGKVIVVGSPVASAASIAFRVANR